MTHNSHSGGAPLRLFSLGIGLAVLLSSGTAMAQGSVVVTSGGDGEAQAAANANAAPEQSSERDTGSGATQGGPEVGSDLTFGFHGFFRAPMRIGLGKNDDPADGQADQTIHDPLVPDEQYLSWQNTRHSQRDWAEMFFSLKKDYVTGTLAITAFNFADASYIDPQQQTGVSQGYVTLEPDIGTDKRGWLKVGSHWARYGEAGVYDAGEYDTYLFGRVNKMGYTGHFELDVTPDVTWWVEHGFGTRRPDPNAFNTSKFTLVAHGHTGALIAKDHNVGLHYLHSWSQEEDRQFADPEVTGLPDGSLTVMGAEYEGDLGPAGRLFAGFSRVQAKDALTVGPALLVIHAQGGGDFELGITKNYLDDPLCETTTPPSCSGGNGNINTILGQYEFSLGKLQTALNNPDEAWYGQSRDLVVKLYGMLNMVESDDPEADGVTKMKFGTDIVYSPFPWMNLGLRADRLQPNSEIPEQSFMIVSPRLMFRSDFVSHEIVTIQFSRYIYNQRECGAGSDPRQCVQPPAAAVNPDGFGVQQESLPADTKGAANVRPDINVFRIEASMWW